MRDRGFEGAALAVNMEGRMPNAFTLSARLRLGLAAALAALALIGAGPAAAQTIVAIVNGEPITALDVVHRTKLIEASTRKAPSRQEALDELIDDKLKLSVAKRYSLEISQKDVDNSYNTMAQRARMSPEQFGEMLSKHGITPEAFKAKIKADIAWSQIMRGKFQSQLQVGEKEVLAVLQSKKDEKQEANYQYTLRPILLVVPRGSGEAVFAARKREADALRTRFENCDSGLRLARTLKDTAIRAPVVRSSADLSVPLRKVLDGIAVGRLTAPEVTQQGVEVFALCEKKQITGDTPQKRELQDQLMNEKLQAQSKKYLKELRRSAMIEIR